MIKSIEKVNEYVDTGRRPFYVFADDLQLYLAKGSRLNSTDLLVREWIGANAAQSFGLEVPPFLPIWIEREHWPDAEKMARIGIHWDIPCFASRFVKNAKDISRENAPQIAGHFKNDTKAILQFLKLGIFDLFMAADDRNEYNMNLLLSRSRSGVCLTLIDHEGILNEGSALLNGLAEQTREDSILLSTMGRLIQRGISRADFVNLRYQVVEEFLQWASSSHTSVERWLESCPKEWLSNPDIYRKILNDEFFAEAWVQQVVKQYVEYTELARRA